MAYYLQSAKVTPYSGFPHWNLMQKNLKWRETNNVLMFVTLNDDFTNLRKSQYVITVK